MFKLPEAAQRLGVSIDTARRYVRDGELPSVFIGGAYRISQEDLDAFIESRRGTHPKGQAPHEGATGGAVTQRIQRDYPRFLMDQEEFNDLVEAADDDAAAEISAEIRRAVADVEASRDECEPVPAATNGTSMEFINLLDSYFQKSNRMMLRKVLLGQPVLLEERRREARAEFIRVTEDLDDAGIEQLREDLPAHELERPELWKDPRSRAEEIATRMFILGLILQIRSSEATGRERETLGQLIAS